MTHDRVVLLNRAEQSQDHDFPRRAVSPLLEDHSGEHQQVRAVQAQFLGISPMVESINARPPVIRAYAKAKEDPRAAYGHQENPEQTPFGQMAATCRDALIVPNHRAVSVVATRLIG